MAKAKNLVALSASPPYPASWLPPDLWAGPPAWGLSWPCLPEAPSYSPAIPAVSSIAHTCQAHHLQSSRVLERDPRPSPGFPSQTALTRAPTSCYGFCWSVHTEPCSPSSQKQESPATATPVREPGCLGSNPDFTTSCVPLSPDLTSLCLQIRGRQFFTLGLSERIQWTDLTPLLWAQDRTPGTLSKSGELGGAGRR